MPWRPPRHPAPMPMKLRDPIKSDEFWHDVVRERGWAWSEYRAVLERELEELVPDAEERRRRGLWFWFFEGRCRLTEASLGQLEELVDEDVSLELREAPQLELTVRCHGLDGTADVWRCLGPPQELRPRLEERKQKLQQRLGDEDVEWREDPAELRLEALTQPRSVALELWPMLPVRNETELSWLPVEGLLGGGGFANVLAVRRGENVLALKVAQVGKERYMFRERKVLRHLQPLRHPCIVRLLGCLEVNGKPAYLMPRAHCSLANLLEDEKWRPWWELAAQELMGYDMEHSVLSALFQLQLQAGGSVPKLLHQDIKAENILVTHAPGSTPHPGHLGLVLADLGCAAREGDLLEATTRALLPPHLREATEVVASEDIEWHMFSQLLKQLLGQHLKPASPMAQAEEALSNAWLRSCRWLRKGWNASALLQALGDYRALGMAGRAVVLEAVRGHGWALQFAHQDLKEDREVVLEAVRQDGRALQFAHGDLKKDREVVLEAVLKDSRAWKYAHADLKKDREFVLEAVRQSRWALEFAHEDPKKDREDVLKAVRQHGLALMDLRPDREVVLEAIRRNGRALEFAHEDLKKDKEVVLQAVRQNGFALEFAHEDLKNDRDVILEAVRQNGFALEFAHKDLKQEREFHLEAVLQNGWALQFAHEELKKNRDVVLKAVGQNGLALQFAHEDLKKDGAVVLEAVRQNGLSLKVAHEDLKKDRAVVLQAVRQNGLSLKVAHEDLKKDRAVVLEAIRQNGFALLYARKDLKKDRAVVLEAVRQDGWALQFAHEDLKKDRKFVLDAIRQNGWALNYAHEDLKKDREVVLEAVRQDGRALQFAHGDLKKDREVVLEAARQNVLALEFAHKDLKKDLRDRPGSGSANRLGV